MIRILFLAFVVSIFSSCEKERIAEDHFIVVDSLMMDTYCALGASTATLGWQKEVARKISKNYKCYAIGGTTWSQTGATQLDYSTDASNLSANRVMANELVRLIKDKNSVGYNPNLITILCGLNDAAKGATAIGSYSDAFAANFTNVSVEQWFSLSEYKALRESVYGSIRFTIEKLKLEFPNSFIVIITPQQCTASTYSYDNIKRVYDALKQVGARYSVPIVDFFEELGITDAGGLSSQYLRPDGVHPNAAGEKLMTNFLLKRLTQIYIPRK